MSFCTRQPPYEPTVANAAAPGIPSLAAEFAYFATVAAIATGQRKKQDAASAAQG